jgi:hypothetical protein
MRPRLPHVGATLALVAATWLYISYRYEVGSQLNFLSNVLAYSGELENDWFAEGPPLHWVVDRFLGAVPDSLRAGVVFTLWLTALTALWAGFLSICRSLGASLWVGVAAGLVLIPTRIGGFGISEFLFDYFFPNNLAFALAVVSLALLLRARLGWAGIALGLATLVHPQVGGLFAIAFAPVVLLATGRFDPRAALRFAAPLVLVGLPSILQLLITQADAGELSAAERYDLIAVVRAPIHFVYSSFFGWEYLRTGLWLGVLVLSLAVLWRRREARLLGLLTATIAVLCGAGAIAGETGAPVQLVFAQTSRLSALIVLLAVPAGAAVLARAFGQGWAAIALIAVFLLGPLAAETLDLRTFNGLSIGTTEAIMLLVLLAVAIATTLMRVRGGVQARDSEAGAAVPALALVAAFALVAVSLVVEHDDRANNATADGALIKKFPEDDAVTDVAEEAGERTRSGELILSPPEVDGVRVFSERPTVADYGTVPLGDDLDEWRRRMVELSGEPRAFDPDEFGFDFVARAMLLGEGYKRRVASSPALACRYDAKLIISEPLRPVPKWLRPVYRNEYYELYELRARACA